MRRVFLLVAAVLVIAASFLTGCMHRYSVCVPTQQGSECMAGYTKEQAHQAWKLLYFFTDPEVVKTPKGLGKKSNDLQLPNDSGKPTGKPI